jgi:uncharacterized protein (UPF0212 family)
MPPDAPSALDLLEVWEAAHALSPVQQALELLTVARPDVAPRALAELPVGRRDAELLRLRERLFGPHVVALARCPVCAERSELTFTVADIQGPPPGEPTALVERDGYTVRVRPPNSADLMEVQAGDDAAAGERALIARCTLEARHGVVPLGGEELPDAVVDAIAQAMSAADAHAEVQVATVCPACGHASDAVFDVAAFLWREIEAWATRTLDEVHVLASAYGWSEREILSLSAPRRRRYVSMIGQVS